MITRDTHITKRFAEDLLDFGLVQVFEQGVVQSGAIVDDRVQINQWFVQVDLVQCPFVDRFAVGRHCGWW